MSRGQARNTDSACCFSEPLPQQKSEQPWPWRKPEAGREEARSESPVRGEARGQRTRRHRSAKSTRALADRTCAVLRWQAARGAQRRWFSAWLRGLRALWAPLAVRAQPYASLDTVTILTNTANLRLWHFIAHSSCLSKTRACRATAAGNLELILHVSFMVRWRQEGTDGALPCCDTSQVQLFSLALLYCFSGDQLATFYQSFSFQYITKLNKDPYKVLHLHR